MEKNPIVLTPILAGLVIGSLVVGVCGGMWYQNSKNLNNFSGRMMYNNRLIQQENQNERGGNNRGQTGSGMMGRGAIAGEVTAKDDNSITVKLLDGSSKTIILDSNTKYNESTTVGIEKVVIGSKVAAFGTNTTDGTTTATSIEINPLLRGQN